MMRAVGLGEKNETKKVFAQEVTAIKNDVIF